MAKKPKKPDLSAEVLFEPLVPAVACPCGCGRPADRVDIDTGEPLSILCLFARSKAWQDEQEKAANQKGAE